MDSRIFGESQEEEEVEEKRPTCYGRSGDLEPLGAQVFVLALEAAGRVVNFIRSLNR